MTSHSEAGMDPRNRARDLLVSLVLMAAFLAGMVPVASCGRSNRGPARGESFIAFDTPPEVLHMEPAEYPKSAMQAADEGTVSVLITVDGRGTVIDARVVWTDTS